MPESSAPPTVLGQGMLRRLATVLVLVALAFLAGSFLVESAQAVGEGTETTRSYRDLFNPETDTGKTLNPRNLVWIAAQLHLLFAAFVLAVPMFVVIIEVVGLVTKDEEQAKRYDDLAHEFCRLLTTAFSATAILGAILTFLCLGLYPKLFNYLVEVFGPTMYLYACIFFGESFSLYLYYYGWGKFKKWTHVSLGLLLNFFGVTLMLIANAWTTFMMAPGGLDETGAVVSRYDAFFNFLLHPINIHRLIANLCMGGSVAAAYAAFKWLSTKDSEKRAHYDWMGYIGNFIAILALLPLPFAGYYLGFEIYAYNQQLGIYMMGGVLSWLFIMQAVLIGVLFLAANYYLWLGMDRIEGAERYRGWIKWLLGVITLGVLVWATPKSIILSSAEIEEIGGTAHPVLGVLGVMSAKNTAVNLIILTTFLSFILYRRGNKVPTVPWARAGQAVQAIMFGLAAAVVVIIGIGGYIPGWWLESTKRVAMSPWQVVAVLICMVVVMAIDIPLLGKAKEIGRIRWGEVSARSQYTLILLAVSFTWLMALMGFVRSSLRQHWHVYEVMKDESTWAYTPALGPATLMVTVVVILFFALVSVIFWISSLGAHEAEEHEEAPAAAHPGLVAEEPAGFPTPVLVTVGVAVLAVVGGLALFGGDEEETRDRTWVSGGRSKQAAAARSLEGYGTTKGLMGQRYKVPIDRAMKLISSDPSLLAPTPLPDFEDLPPAQRGQILFSSVYPCSTCHSVDGAKLVGPTVKGMWGKTVKVDGGLQETYNEAYVKESILDPNAKISEGYAPAMILTETPSEAEIADIIEYLKTLK